MKYGWSLTYLQKKIFSIHSYRTDFEGEPNRPLTSNEACSSKGSSIILEHNCIPLICFIRSENNYAEWGLLQFIMQQVDTILASLRNGINSKWDCSESNRAGQIALCRRCTYLSSMSFRMQWLPYQNDMGTQHSSISIIGMVLQGTPVFPN